MATTKLTDKAVLAAKAPSGIHYDANSYIAEKRRALDAWESLLLVVAGERAPMQNVEVLRGR